MYTVIMLMTIKHKVTYGKLAYVLFCIKDEVSTIL